MRGWLRFPAILSLVAIVVTIGLSSDARIDDLGLLLLLFSIAPVLWMLDRIFGGKPDPADFLPRCTACGYDLRATPNRCPECGRIPDKEPTFDE